MNTETQSPPSDFRFQREKAWLALLLAWVAGFADAVGFVTLIHIFTSHISGNTVTMGVHLGHHEWNEAFHSAYPIPLFLLGFFAGAVLETIAKRNGIRRRLSLGLVVEVALLLVFMLYGSRVADSDQLRAHPAWEFQLFTALLAIALGLQSSTLRRVRGQSVHTTYITGMLTQFTEDAEAWLFHLFDRLRGKPPGESNPINEDHVGKMILYGGIWLAFALGAICGGFGEQKWGLFSLTAPLCVLAFIILCDLIRPVHV
ncbi:MAG: hypothetical protein JWR26_792 [Pedosphaera sp.]|nr:hypothetical protein [Pedosphaera sp.]